MRRLYAAPAKKLLRREHSRPETTGPASTAALSRRPFAAVYLVDLQVENTALGTQVRCAGPARWLRVFPDGLSMHRIGTPAAGGGITPGNDRSRSTRRANYFGFAESSQAPGMLYRMRWTLRRQAGSSRRTKTLPRTPKSCGPGTATVASSRRTMSRRRRWQDVRRRLAPTGWLAMTVDGARPTRPADPRWQTPPCRR